MRPWAHGAYTRFASCLVLACALCLTAARAQAQKLSTQGDRFAVNGSPRFLTFVSLFGAADGTLKPDELTRLPLILDQARLERMIVDVSLTDELLASDGRIRLDYQFIEC